jgi:hypothetical protein
MTVYRFLFAPVLLAAAVFTGVGDRPRTAPPPSSPVESRVESRVAPPAELRTAPAAVPAGASTARERRAPR